MTTMHSHHFVPEWSDGDKLRKVRRHLRLSQAEFAQALNVTRETYAQWESDRNRVPDLKSVARRIKEMAGTPLWWWFDTEPPVSPTDGPGGPRAPRLTVVRTAAPVTDDELAVDDDALAYLRMAEDATAQSADRVSGRSAVRSRKEALMSIDTAA